MTAESDGCSTNNWSNFGAGRGNVTMRRKNILGTYHVHYIIYTPVSQLIIQPAYDIDTIIITILIIIISILKRGSQRLKKNNWFCSYGGNQS